jgi:hypothetical protein
MQQSQAQVKLARDFRQHLERHFRFIGGLDNLPLLATAPRRNGGRKELALTMADMGLVKGVEVGCRYGASALLWKEFIPGLTLTCYDPYRAYHRVSQERQDKIYAGAQENAAAG